MSSYVIYVIYLKVWTTSITQPNRRIFIGINAVDYNRIYAKHKYRQIFPAYKYLELRNTTEFDPSTYPFVTYMKQWRW